MALVDFADCLLFTDVACKMQSTKIRIVKIEALRSSRAYSDFILKDLVGSIKTSHCLIAQWDGHVINAACWDPAFLMYDYIGASWPQF
ncbi:DUF5672 family protein, partial [Novosphingobium fluoreni]|uniref:DUF5672 family protein n=1 Tax=Novosphingobium fluoreni TaxID=1391222 RepID=UPI003DA0EF67